MEEIIFNKKPLPIKETYSDYTYRASFKNKDVFVVRFDDAEDMDDFLYRAKKIFNTGVSCPKVVKIDKKNLIVLLTYIDGIKPIDILRERPLDEKIYELIYKQNFMARINKISVDLDPSKWIYVESEEKLYYVGYTFSNPKEKEYVLREGIRYWNFTREFAQYCEERNLSYNRDLFKSEFETNKQILLIACKYYK